MKRRPLLLLLGFVAVVAFPQHAWANAGTPLMWAGLLHLVFGNVLIGVGEGALLAWLLKAHGATLMPWFACPKRFRTVVGAKCNI